MSFFGGPSDAPSYDKKKYENLSMSIRQTVLERARSRCQKCSVKFGPSNPPHFEHINGSRKDNRPINLRALCAGCFKAVEEKENSKGLLDGIKSKFGV